MAVENTRKLKMIFKTNTGSDKNVSLNYAKDGLKSGDGATLVHDAMTEVISQQPFDETIASMVGAKVIETTTTDVAF